MAKYVWKRLDMAGNGQKRTESPEMTGNGWD